MTDPIQESRTRAEILHGRILRQDESALLRLRILPAFRKSSLDQLREAAAEILRRDCLAVISAEYGFPNWPAAKRVLSPDPPPEPITDFGTLLWTKTCGGFINRWYKTHDEAAAARQESGGYLLAHKTHFVVVEHFFIEGLGLDPQDPDWKAIGFDWVKPEDTAARARLYGKLLALRPRAA